MWREELHPRAADGKFVHGLGGLRGQLDLESMRLANRRHGSMMREWEANLARQDEFSAKREAGTLTGAEDAEWDRLSARASDLQAQLPRAALKGLRPATDGAWYRRDRNGVLGGVPHDEQGRKLPAIALQGARRVGDHPDEASGGLWQLPGETWRGGVPKLRTDAGHVTSLGRPEDSRSLRDKSRRGAFARDELKFERAAREIKPRTPGGSRVTVQAASPEVRGSYNVSESPVSRWRTAGTKRRRREATVITGAWIDRLEARMRAQGN